MSSSPVMSATEENLVNELDENLYKAIDNFTTKSEESEEAFISKFLYLKKDEIVRPTDRDSSIPIQVLKKSSENIEKKNSFSENTPISTNCIEEQIDEEILDEGVKTSVLSSGNGCNKITKFDNFIVDSDDSSDILVNGEDDVQNSSYVASFDKKIDNDKRNTDETERLSHEALNSLVSNECINNEPLIDEENEDLEIVDEDREISPEFEGDGLNPGEIEDNSNDPSIEEVHNNTCLDASMKYTKPGVISNNSISSKSVEVSDAVEPFSLDEDFDYDNVVLTAKFTPSEMEYLISFKNQGTQDTDNT